MFFTFKVEDPIDPSSDPIGYRFLRLENWTDGQSYHFYTKISPKRKLFLQSANFERFLRDLHVYDCFSGCMSVENRREFQEKNYDYPGKR